MTNDFRKMRSQYCLLLFPLRLIWRCGPDPADQDDVIRVETDVTNLLFSVTIKQHRFVTSLRRKIFAYWNGIQELFAFKRDGSPGSGVSD